MTYNLCGAKENKLSLLFHEEGLLSFFTHFAFPVSVFSFVPVPFAFSPALVVWQESLPQEDPAVSSPVPQDVQPFPLVQSAPLLS